MHQIQIEKTLDVELVERQLAELWQQNTEDRNLETVAPILRARVANLLVFVPGEKLLDEVEEMIQELTAIHPSRVLIMLGDRNATDHDIEMYVAAFCQTDKRTGARRLCCEEVTLKASGPFINELPSAALPLRVSDLSTYLWWRDELQTSDKVLATLLAGVDRLVIDSNEFKDPLAGLEQTNALFINENLQVGISDLNWARLTFWRGLLADFYDVPVCQPWLEKIDYVKVDFIAPEKARDRPAPQALLISGWLASRLGWRLVECARANDESFVFEFEGPARVDASATADAGDQGRRKIKLELTRVERAELKPGRLVEVRLLARESDDSVSFRVGRSEDARHLFAEARLAESVQRGRVLPVRNRSAAQLLSREMEILCNDDIYQETVAMVTRIIKTMTAGQKS